MNKIILAALLIPAITFAHSGGTNSEGCHTNHITNFYHCHHGDESYSGSLFSRQFHAAKRDPDARKVFYQHNPCPVNGNTSGPCPGYHVDHVIPLACGGLDHPVNMQWLPAKENLVKGDKCPWWEWDK